MRWTFRPRFTLRFMLVLMALVAIFLAWVVRPLLRERYIAAELESAGASVFYGGYSIAGIDLNWLPPWIVNACGESMFAHVTHVRLCRPVLQKRLDLAILGQLPALEDLTLDSFPVTDHEMEGLVICRNVRTLDLCLDETASLSNASVMRLAELPLVNLRIEGVFGSFEKSPLTDTWLQAASQIGTLRSLSLDSCYNVTDRGLCYLAHRRDLGSLRICEAYKITEDGLLQCIAQMKGLRDLHVEALPITDRSCRAIASLTNLRSLRIDYCPAITDEGVSALGALSQLEQFALIDANEWARTHLEDWGVSGIGQAHNIGDRGLQCLSQMKELRELKLGRLSITDHSCRIIALLTNLRRLYIKECPMITDEGVSALGALSGLEELHLEGVNVSAVGIAALTQLGNLETLSLDGVSCTWGMCEELQKFKKLKVLWLRPNGKMSAEMENRLKAALPKCEVNIK